MLRLPLTRTCLGLILISACPLWAQAEPAAVADPALLSPQGEVTLLLPQTLEVEREPVVLNLRPSQPVLPARKTTVGTPPGTFYQRPGEIFTWLKEVPLSDPSRARIIPFGKSTQGRELLALEIRPKVSNAKTRRLAVLCRQHGDEPEATASGTLFVKQWLDSPNANFRRWADNTSLLIILISNPDGAERYERRTAVNIDMNRDWEKKKSPEVRAISRVISNWHPHLVIDVHQWLPARHMPPPMAEASGGNVAKKAAQAMAWGNKQRGFYLSARSRWGASTLCHRYFGQKAGVPAILLESRHLPTVPGAREVAIQQEVVALWSATASLSKQ